MLKPANENNPPWKALDRSCSRLPRPLRKLRSDPIQSDFAPLLDSEDDALGDLGHLSLAVLDRQFGAERPRPASIDRTYAAVPPVVHMTKAQPGSKDKEGEGAQIMLG